MAIGHDMQPAPAVGAGAETGERVGALAGRHALRSRCAAIGCSRLLRLLEQLGIKDGLVRGGDHVRHCPSGSSPR